MAHKHTLAPMPPLPPPALASQVQPPANPVTSNSTDDELRAAMLSGGVVLAHVQVGAKQAYDQARKIPSGPIVGVDRYWQDAQRATMHAIAQAGAAAGTQSAADWTSRIKQLRIALAAGEHYRAVQDHWATLGFNDRVLLRDKDAADLALKDYAEMLENRNRNNLVPAADFDALTFLVALNKRGIAVSVSAAGALSVRPGTLLTPQDREAMQANKAAILAALGDELAVA